MTDNFVTFGVDPKGSTEPTALEVKIEDFEAIHIAIKEAMKQLDAAQTIAFMAIQELNKVKKEG